MKIRNYIFRSLRRIQSVSLSNIEKCSRFVFVFFFIERLCDGDAYNDVESADLCGRGQVST